VSAESEARDAIFASIAEAARQNPVPEGVLKLASAYALMQPEEEEEDSTLHTLSGTTMIAVDDGYGMADRGGIGFTPR
jgi:hypothetical protein